MCRSPAPFRFRRCLAPGERVCFDTLISACPFPRGRLRIKEPRTKNKDPRITRCEMRDPPPRFFDSALPASRFPLRRDRSGLAQDDRGEVRDPTLHTVHTGRVAGYSKFEIWYEGDSASGIRHRPARLLRYADFSAPISPWRSPRLPPLTLSGLAYDRCLMAQVQNVSEVSRPPVAPTPDPNGSAVFVLRSWFLVLRSATVTGSGPRTSSPPGGRGILQFASCVLHLGSWILDRFGGGQKTTPPCAHGGVGPPGRAELVLFRGSRSGG
jgi:hypothetical protein